VKEHGINGAETWGCAILVLVIVARGRMFDCFIFAHVIQFPLGGFCFFVENEFNWALKFFLFFCSVYKENITQVLRFMLSQSLYIHKVRVLVTRSFNFILKRNGRIIVFIKS
jgi:hypothetical protein